MLRNPIISEKNQYSNVFPPLTHKWDENSRLLVPKPGRDNHSKVRAVSCFKAFDSNVNFSQCDSSSISVNQTNPSVNCNTGGLWGGR
jgi:hypothetical protein